MPEFARERVAVPVARRLNAMDAFIDCCEGFSIKRSDDSLDREIFQSLDVARSLAGGQMR